MSEEDKKSKDPDEGAEQLSDLLDSALGNFSRPGRTTDDDLDSWMEAADAKAAQHAAKDFHNMLQQMVTVQEEALKQEAVVAAEGGEDEARSMMEAMKELMKHSGAIADASNPEELLSRLEEMGGSDSSIAPMMSMMMEAFISKEVLYPPLKEMHNEYPAYLEKHKDSLDAETLERYQAQYQIMGAVCAEFEKMPAEGEGVEGTTDEASSVPAQQLAQPSSQVEVIGRLLVQLQMHGYPPQELTGALPAGFAIDPSTGTARVEDASVAAEACTIM